MPPRPVAVMTCDLSILRLELSRRRTATPRSKEAHHIPRRASHKRSGCFVGEALTSACAPRGTSRCSWPTARDLLEHAIPTRGGPLVAFHHAAFHLLGLCIEDPPDLGFRARRDSIPEPVSVAPHPLERSQRVVPVLPRFAATRFLSARSKQTGRYRSGPTAPRARTAQPRLVIRLLVRGRRAGSHRDRLRQFGEHVNQRSRHCRAPRRWVGDFRPLGPRSRDRAQRVGASRPATAAATRRSTRSTA